MTSRRADPPDPVADALQDTLISPNEGDRNDEPANVVDGGPRALAGDLAHRPAGRGGERRPGGRRGGQGTGGRCPAGDVRRGRHDRLRDRGQVTTADKKRGPRGGGWRPRASL